MMKHLSRAIRAVRLTTILALLFLLSHNVRSASAQSLGEIARQQRERVRASRVRVFTNEDLARQKILEPSAQAKPDAAVPAEVPVRIATHPGNAPAQAPPVPVWSAATPLGDVARYYRQRKEALPAQQSPQSPGPPVVAVTTPLMPSSHAQPPATAVTAAQEPLRKLGRVVAHTSLAPEMHAQVPDTVVPRVIQVNAGDSLWKIAARHLGDSSRWREIAAANPEISNPNRIRAGQHLRLPEALMVAAVPAHQPQQLIRVQRGDSLWKLAKATFGDGQAWSCIAEHNPQINPARIYPGQVLTLPSLCSPLS